MFAYLRSTIRKNRKKLVWSTSVIAVIYFGFGYLRKKFIEYQLKLSEERFSREQIRRRFEQTQKDSLYTIYALVPVLSSPIFDSSPVESITRSLQAKRLQKRNGSGSGTLSDEVSTITTNDSIINHDQEKRSKIELWNDLKSQNFTRLLTLIYSNASLILLTRLQLNILARKEYLEDAIKLAVNKHGFQSKIELNDQTNQVGDGIDDTNVTEQAYLSFSWWLLNRGWIQIKQRVQFAVDEVFGDINPRTELTLDEFAILLKKTQNLIENVSPNNNNNDDNFISSSLLPPKNLETFVVQQTLDEDDLQVLSRDNSNLRILLDETFNYVNSSSSLIVLSSLVNVGITTFLNHIALNLINKKQSQSQSQEQIEEVIPNELKVKLVEILVNTSKASEVFKNKTGNEYVNNMDKVSELDELSASVYSNFEV